jgi:hypothetical protein
MEPSSRARRSIEQPSQLVAKLMGTVVALLTLTVPLLTIAHFSSLNQSNWQAVPQLLPNAPK